MQAAIPKTRLRVVRDDPPKIDADYVLYWMTSNRRLEHNFALDQAIGWAKELGKPLVIMESLRSDYPWASDRIHSFVLAGMAEHQKALASSGVLYLPVVERKRGATRGLLRELSASAAVTVGDDHPGFFFPEMLRAAAREARSRLELVDSCGLLPVRASARTFTTARSFRIYLQKSLQEHLAYPRAAPLRNLELPEIRELSKGRIRQLVTRDLSEPSRLIASLPIDHSVPPAPLAGGSRAARRSMRRFLGERLGSYASHRNEVDPSPSSGLSPYLHFGQISTHEVFRALTQRDWALDRTSSRCDGRREGWWGLDPAREAFLDQLITWRELGFNMAATRADHAELDSLPSWALSTLRRHEGDPRPAIYTPDLLDRAATHDPIWNAAQTQLRTEGVMHNYLRMLWGKKILEWTPSPEAALETMLELNNRYALDGRDPNSISGIFWVLGRYDRPWGPERPVFGTVRFMSSESTKRKLSLRAYLDRYGPRTT